LLQRVEGGTAGLVQDVNLAVDHARAFGVESLLFRERRGILPFVLVASAL
jgi:hypothetical protein